jgi:LmbE family N-acetylglucosaminyl deacetylase
MTTVDLAVPECALAIGAHPDDIEFGCSGTLAKWAAAGCEVHYAVCTDGSKGSWDAAQDVVELVAVRQEEQRAAAATIGAKGVHFLGQVDGELTSDLHTRALVCRVIRDVRPDVVLGHDPWRRYRLHPDHRHAGFLAVEGIVAARDPHFFAEQGLAPHRPQHLLLWEADVVDHVESVDKWLTTKLAALLCHRSQWRSTLHIETGADGDPGAGHSEFVERIHHRAAQHGNHGGLLAGEAFKRLDEL